MKPIVCIPGVITGLAGSWCGAKFALLISEHVLELLLMLILPLVAVYLFGNRTIDKNIEKPITIRTVVMCCIVSLLIGGYNGVYGVGTGTFLILLFTGLCQMQLRDAAGVTKAVNLAANIVSLTVFLLNGRGWITLGLLAGCFSMGGNYLGSRCFTKNGAKYIKPVIFAVFVLFYLRVFLNYFL